MRWPVAVDLPASTWPTTTRFMCTFSFPIIRVLPCGTEKTIKSCVADLASAKKNVGGAEKKSRGPAARMYRHTHTHIQRERDKERQTRTLKLQSKEIIKKQKTETKKRSCSQTITFISLLGGLCGGLGDLAGTALLLRHRLDDADGDRLAHVTHGKAAKRSVVVEHLHAHGLLRHHAHHGGVTGLDRLGVLLKLLAGAAVDLGLDLGELARDVAGVAVEHRRIAVADLAGVVQDDHLRREVGRLLWGVVLRVAAHVATADVLHGHVLHVEADVVAGRGLDQLLVVHLNRLHLRRHVGGRKRHHVAGLHRARLHATDRHGADTADLVHVLQRQAQRLVAGAHRGLQHVECLQQRGALVPRHIFRLVNHVVALPAGDGDEAHLLHVVPNLLQVRRHLLHNLIVALLGEVHRLVVHLVAAHNHLLHAEREGEQRVLACLAVLRDARLKLTLR
ncbi:hypothetical protein ECC02_011819 [Trypanosoma cruzi]|uniref:Uncharacterized protein n=1 Tax=Trypanosoma cruzi TaxID=5693 RepID=A0A7J6XMR3_TRYCR|nr:hypothetical protein ECC02_011819 [Trypanosoma cruzi]